MFKKLNTSGRSGCWEESLGPQSHFLALFFVASLVVDDNAQRGPVARRSLHIHCRFRHSANARLPVQLLMNRVPECN